MQTDQDMLKAMILLGTCAIFAILTIVLLVLTPFLPDEIVTGVIALITGFMGRKYLPS